MFVSGLILIVVVVVGALISGNSTVYGLASVGAGLIVACILDTLCQRRKRH